MIKTFFSTRRWRKEEGGGWIVTCGKAWRGWGGSRDGGAGLIAQAVAGGGGSRAPALRWRRPEAGLEIAGVTPDLIRGRNDGNRRVPVVANIFRQRHAVPDGKTVNKRLEKEVLA